MLRSPRLTALTAALALACLGTASDAQAGGLNDPSCQLSAAHPYPIVLVHGHGGNVNGFGPLVDALTAAGHCVYGTNYGQMNGTGPYGHDHLNVTGGQIRTVIEQVLATTGAAKVDVIGHSAGTGVLQNYILLKGGAAVVHRLISFGGLHHPYAHVGAAQFGDVDLFLPNLIATARLVDPDITAQEVIRSALALYTGAGGQLFGIDPSTLTSNFASDLFDPVYWNKLHGSLSEPPFTYLRWANGKRTRRTNDAAPNVCYTNIVGIADLITGASAGFQDAAPNVDNFLLISLADHGGILFDPASIAKTRAALGAPCAVATAGPGGTDDNGDGEADADPADGDADALGGCAAGPASPATLWLLAVAGLLATRRRRAAR